MCIGVCRFFVVRDGFLLYYPEGERREFEKTHCLNLHPKVCFFLYTDDDKLMFIFVVVLKCFCCIWLFYAFNNELLCPENI